jgi:hypothetical protein
MRWGSRGLLQWLHTLIPVRTSFQLVRRFLPRAFECLRLGTAMNSPLL